MTDTIMFAPVGAMIAIFVVCMMMDFGYRWKVYKAINLLQLEVSKIDSCEQDCHNRIRKRQTILEIQQLIKEAKLDREIKFKEE